MLAMADKYGRVFGAIPGIASRARVPTESAEKAINLFLSPDPYSRTTANEGRRIEKIDGGWRLLNHAKYRKMRDEEHRREQNREAKRRQRAVSAKRVNVSHGQPTGQPIADAEAEAEKNNNSARQLSGVDKVVFNDELKRIAVCIRDIRQSYDSHNEMSAGHRKELKILKDRMATLQKLLGVVA